VDIIGVKMGHVEGRAERNKASEDEMTRRDDI